MVPDLIVLALDYYRTPLRFPHLADPEQGLPKGVEKLVDDVGNALSPQNLEAIAEVLGTRPAEIKRAVHFFLQQVLLSAKNDHYRALGLSENASDETIRRHYQLLIGIFHPDRFRGDYEYDATYTACINEAYNVLKHPAKRQEYDRQRRSVQDVAKGIDKEPVESPSSTLPVGPSDEPGARVLRRTWPTRYLLWGGGSTALAVGLVLLFSGRQPSLRANPELANDSSATPSYLETPFINPLRHPGDQTSKNAKTGPDATQAARQKAKVSEVTRPNHRAQAVHSGPAATVQSPPPSEPDLENEKAKDYVHTEPKSGGRAERLRPKPSPVPSVSERPQGSPLDLIARLANYYYAGNLADLVDLFTADAQVNNGRGTGLIRKDYARLFAETSKRRLSIGNLSWESENGGKIIGRGIYQTRIKKRRNAEWKSSSGKLLIELVPGLSNYRISKMIYR